MLRHKKTGLFFVTFVFVASMVAANQSQNQNNSIPARQEQRDEESYGPIVDYKGPTSTSTADATRDADVEVNETETYLDNLQAMPAAKSDAIVIGEVVDARVRYLQQPNTPSVISEFTIRVGEVFKANSVAPLVSGMTAVVKREGGRLRYASGRVVRFTPSGQRMPRVGRRYVLFLKQAYQGEVLFILTGYELRSGKVFPVDDLQKFDAHKGEDETTFLSKVREAIANCPETSR